MHMISVRVIYVGIYSWKQRNTYMFSCRGHIKILLLAPFYFLAFVFPLLGSHVSVMLSKLLGLSRNNIYIIITVGKMYIDLPKMVVSWVDGEGEH